MRIKITAPSPAPCLTVASLPKTYRHQARSLLEGGALRGLFSHLEIVSIANSSMIDYIARLLFFVQWCQVNRADWCDEQSLDLAVVVCFDELFWRNAPVSDGLKMVAALKFLLASATTSGSLHLPRAARVLKAWAVKRPASQRTPLPWLCLTAMLGYLCFNKDIIVAINLLVQFVTYLRPGVCDALLVKQVVAPAKLAGPGYHLWAFHLYPTELLMPGKTGGFDESVVIDQHLWLDPFLQMLTANRKGDERLWHVSPKDIMNSFKAAVLALGLDSLHPCRYSLRHGGASHDLLKGQRTLFEVKHRGHWRSDSSLLRYGKPARAQRVLNSVHPDIVAYGKHVADHLPEIFHGQLIVPPPGTTPKGSTQ